MIANRPRSLGELISSGGALSGLTEEVERRLDLADYLRAAVPEGLRAAISACSLRPDGTLVISTSGPEWAARLRFESDAVLCRCRQRFPAAARVKVRVERNGS